MDSKYLRLLPLFLLLLLSFAMAMGLFSRQTNDHDERIVGKRLASFSIPSVTSNTPFSPKLWNGRVVLLNVFASWCTGCHEEHEVLMKLAANHIPVYGIAWKDKPEKLAAWLRAHGNPYQQIGLDEEGTTTVPLTLTGIPETYIINKDGTVFYHYKVPLTEQMVDSLIIPAFEQLNRGNAK